MKKPIFSLILSLMLVGSAQAQRSSGLSLARPDLSIKTLNFNGMKLAPGVNGVELIPVLQKNTGDKINVAQTISIRMVDSFGKPVATCELSVPAWTNDETTTSNLQTCAIGSEMFSRISRFYVTADASKQVVESNEDNNEFVSPKPSIVVAGSSTIAVIPGSKKPDLVIHAMKFRPDFNKLTITPKNICPGAANGFFVSVVFHENGEESSKSVYSIGQKVLSLNGGYQTIDVTLDVSAFTQGKDVRGTTGFMGAVLRVINIPVKQAFTCGHSLPVFTSENLYLSHGDDLYSGFSRPNPNGKGLPFPSEELFISQSQYNEWFGPNAANKCDNVGRRTRELALKYLPHGLVISYCKDKSSGASHDGGEVYKPFKGFYTVAQLEAADLWGRLEKKLAEGFDCGEFYKKPN